MNSVPSAPPRGYSYVENATHEFGQYLNKNKFPSYSKIVAEALIDEVLNKGKCGRRATILVRKGVSALHKTPSGKHLISKITSTSLGKSVQGAAAISHVSKIVRSHGLSNFGVMVFNDGKALKEYFRRDIDGSELGNKLFMETMSQSGDMVGWMAGASLAGFFLCPPYGATAVALIGSMAGRMVLQSIARAIMDK